MKDKRLLSVSAQNLKFEVHGDMDLLVTFKVVIVLEVVTDIRLIQFYN